MKKKQKYILVSIILLALVCSFGFYQIIYKDNEKLEIDINDSKLDNNLIAVMVETESNSGIYEQLASNTWPTEGYTFNQDRSYCENGSEITWNSSSKSINVNVNKSDKCYIYFDKDAA